MFELDRKLMVLFSELEFFGPSQHNCIRKCEQHSCVA